MGQSEAQGKEIWGGTHAYVFSCLDDVISTRAHTPACTLIFKSTWCGICNTLSTTRPVPLDLNLMLSIWHSLALTLRKIHLTVVSAHHGCVLHCHHTRHFDCSNRHICLLKIGIESGRRVVPTELGITLIRGYQLIDPELCKPQMRHFPSGCKGKDDEARADQDWSCGFKRGSIFSQHMRARELRHIGLPLTKGATRQGLMALGGKALGRKRQLCRVSHLIVCFRNPLESHVTTQDVTIWKGLCKPCLPSWKPRTDGNTSFVRAHVEQQIALVAANKADKSSVVLHTLQQFQAKFLFFVAKIGRADALFEASFSPLSSSGEHAWCIDPSCLPMHHFHALLCVQCSNLLFRCLETVHEAHLKPANAPVLEVKEISLNMDA
eukprot:1160857-Pelagomonas_calceolata.AAC.8